MPSVRHVTLVANTAQLVTLDDTNSSAFEVLNRNGLGEIYISHDGTASPVAPTVGGNNFDVVPAATGASMQIRRTGTGVIAVRLISAAATTCSVRGIS